MGFFKWLENLFSHEEGRDFCRPKRKCKPTKTRTKKRGIQRYRIRLRCNRPSVKKYIQERLDFIPNSKIFLDDMYNDYVSWSVVHGENFETKNMFGKALNFH